MMKLTIAVALGALSPALALAGGDGAQKWNSDEHGVVLGGYDVVAYHTQGQPVRGRPAFTGRYEGGTFYFSSPENLAAFEKQPRRRW